MLQQSSSSTSLLPVDIAKLQHIMRFQCPGAPFNSTCNIDDMVQMKRTKMTRRLRLIRAKKVQAIKALTAENEITFSTADHRHRGAKR